MFGKRHGEVLGTAELPHLISSGSEGGLFCSLDYQSFEVTLDVCLIEATCFRSMLGNLSSSSAENRVEYFGDDSVSVDVPMNTVSSNSVPLRGDINPSVIQLPGNSCQRHGIHLNRHGDSEANSHSSSSARDMGDNSNSSRGPYN